MGTDVVTSFDRGVTRFTWLMIGLISVMVPLVFLINGLTKHDWLEALLFAVAIAPLLRNAAMRSARSAPALP